MAELTSTSENLSTTRFISNLASLTSKQFSGMLVLENNQELECRLYFDKGRLIWTTGGVHLWRRWQRHLRQFCPQLSKDISQIFNNNIYVSWQYYVLNVLVEEQVISLDQASKVINHTLIEILFDLIQQNHQNKLNIEVINCQHRGELSKPLTALSLYSALAQVKPLWDAWCASDLVDFSPNLAPIIIKPDVLQQVLAPLVYERMSALFNEKNTLRDLSVYLHQDLIKLSRSLAKYVRSGAIDLKLVDDILADEAIKYNKYILKDETSAKTQGINDLPPQAIPAKTKFLIASVDDCALINKIMRKMIVKSGYDFLGIEESILALPQLIDKRPDLIFLDIDMPVANGYEICSQIRRVPELKNIPVIILTGKDGLIDRTRAHLSGCSEFIVKPISMTKINEVVAKYLENKTVEKANKTRPPLNTDSAQEVAY